MAEKSGPKYTRIRFVRGTDRSAIAQWFEDLGYRVAIWAAEKDSRGVWEVLYVPDDRVTGIPPVDVDLDDL